MPGANCFKSTILVTNPGFPQISVYFVFVLDIRQGLTTRDALKNVDDFGLCRTKAETDEPLHLTGYLFNENLQFFCSSWLKS